MEFDGIRLMESAISNLAPRPASRPDALKEMKWLIFCREKVVNKNMEELRVERLDGIDEWMGNLNDEDCELESWRRRVFFGVTTKGRWVRWISNNRASVDDAGCVEEVHEDGKRRTQKWEEEDN